MKNFLLAFSIGFISCGPNDISITNKKGTANNSAPPTSFTCNYYSYKNKSKHLLKQYQLDPNAENKKNLLEQIRDSLFTCWFGTPWDFNGITEVPGEGKIACGYFVTTLLRDMGAKVKRIQHAQCASEEMIKAVCVRNTIHRFSNQEITAFTKKINELGKGLYVVGLDFHTGFILNDGNEIYFIHANYAGKKVVEKEIASGSSVLSNSKYRVIGKVI
jgi:hypothetical protein